MKKILHELYMSERWSELSENTPEDPFKTLEHMMKVLPLRKNIKELVDPKIQTGPSYP